MKRGYLMTIALVMVISFLGVYAWAVPPYVNYQGELTDSSGVPVADGNYIMKFHLYDVVTGGSPKWTEQQNVKVTGGIYNVQLGSQVAFPADLFDSASLYLEMEIYSLVSGWETLTPRQAVTCSAFSMKAADADTVAGLTPPEIASISHGHDGSDITTGTVVKARIDPAIARDSEITWGNLANIPSDLADGDDVGITTETDPKVPDHVKDGINWLEVSNRPAGLDDGDDVGISTAQDYGRSGVAANLYEGTQALRNRYLNAAGPDSVSGSSSSTMLQASNTGTGAGLRGSSQSHHGTIGYSDANNKAGVFGNSPNGYGVWGNSVNSHAVFGQSTGGRGVKGVSAAGGVYGESPQGVGVEGKSNTNDGVKGVTLASDKSGVFGHSDTGNGVTGRSGGASGVLGVTTSSQPGDAGVTARNEGSALALRAEGDVLVADGAFRGNIEPGGGAPFPRPAWDSGWVDIAPGQNLVLPHTVGGNVDDYVIDFQQKDTTKEYDGQVLIGIHNKFIGGRSYYYSNLRDHGAYWHDLKPHEISVERFPEDHRSDQIRIRIWVVR